MAPVPSQDEHFFLLDAEAFRELGDLRTFCAATPSRLQLQVGKSRSPFSISD
jgi:hypothetical protein